MLNWSEIEDRAVLFSKRWKNCDGNERQQAQTYEKDFMYVFGVDWHEGLHEYSVRDLEGREGLIDYLLPGKIIIEMKSKGESLIKAYNQCYDYVKCLKPEEYPELLMVSDFEYIQVTNLKTMQTFNKFKISTLSKHIRMFACLAEYDFKIEFKEDIEVNIKASYKMAKLHDALKEHGYKGKDLEQYLVRLLFCLFAEDTGIFEQGDFEDYIRNSKEDGSDLSARIMSLFSILNIPEDKRMYNTPKELNRFRYINGGLFANFLPPAFFDEKMRKLLLECCDFDWSYISPAIFGAMFQGVMDKEKRREMGAHYTSEENILKLIEPLFLSDLKYEFEKSKNTKKELEIFHDKLANLKFLDPACGCGNFLIITYRELRLLEFEVLKMIYGIYNEKQLGMIPFICKVSINQFYGIESEEFPSQIAQVGLLLMKHQMDRKISNYFGMNIIDFPIKESGNIVHGNALQIDWENIVKKYDLNYIIGNPPFKGKKEQTIQQKQDMKYIFKDCKNYGILDYVTAWYKKSIEYIQLTSIKCAFVSTNSISQGEQASVLWEYLYRNYKISINFAYRTFCWKNEAKGNAAVHCVIIGFSNNDCYKKNKIIYDECGKPSLASNINQYLIDGPTVFVKSRSNQISGELEISYGSMPIDNGNLILSEEEKNRFITTEPITKKFIKPYIGGKELINNKHRWCLWLKDISPKEIHSSKMTIKRIQMCKDYRLQSNRKQTKELADQPHLFGEIRQPLCDMLVIPKVSSQSRKYIPMDFVKSDIIVNGSALIIPDATLYHFGVLTSNVHMAWLKTVGGRMKSDYQYSSNIVYNNFPWPSVNDKQKNKISECAKKILEIRKNYKNNSLADLYNSFCMPKELVKAHKHLDKEVCKAYGIVWGKEEDCVADLMKMYKEQVLKEVDLKILATNE